MKLILTHASALEYWRRVSTLRAPRPRPSRILTAGSALDETRVPVLQKAFGLSLPLHLLVSREEKRPSSTTVVYHTRNAPLPHGSLMRVSDEVLVVSPECCFLQLPSMQEVPAQIGTGCEFCGTYRLGGAYGQEPLTSIAKLKAYTQRAAGMHGIAQTKRALRYILPNSASPMETVLAMIWTLPPLLGGSGISRPHLNFRIDPGTRTKDMTSQTHYRCDLYWPEAKLDVEYESNLCHTGPNRITKDSKRRDELAALGVTVITVTTGQLYRVSEFRKVTKTVARHVGERLPAPDARFSQRQFDLLTGLLRDLANQRTR